MHPGRLIAISDVHLDSWRDKGDEKRQAFLDFLQWVRCKSGSQHFAIVGDLLDVPQVDRSPILPRYRDVFMHLWELVRAGIMVHWIVGNHDAGLVGLDVAMPRPPLQVASPGALVRSGNADIWLEHGHSMDAWLWAYLQHRATRLSPVDPAYAMAHFGQCTSTDPAVVPAANFVHNTIYEAMQWRAMETGFSEDDKRLGLRVMSQHLDDDFSDVAEAGQTPRLHAEIMDQLARLKLTVADLQSDAKLPVEALELFFPVGLRYYSSLPWRRAARCKLAQVREQHGHTVRGLIMGHVHAPDLYSWDCHGDTVTYGNCGTWSHDEGCFILVEGGEMVAFRRRWDDPLPQL